MCYFVVGKCKAQYAYKGVPQLPTDGRPVITFEVGDVIELLNDDNENWWEVRLIVSNLPWGIGVGGGGGYLYKKQKHFFVCLSSVL